MYLRNKPVLSPLLVITKTCPCNTQRFFSALKIENFIGKKRITILICLLKTLIVGTR